MRRLLVAIVAACLAAAPLTAAPAWADGGVKANDWAPEFDKAAKTAAGKKFRLKSLRGGWVVVTFGASWCKPCKDELPAWDKLAKRYKGKVRFVAVNIDNDPSKGKRFVKKLGLRHMLVVYSPESKTSTADHYVGGDDPKFPTTFVIDPKGVVKHVHPTYHKGDEKKLAAKLDELIGKK